MYNVTFQSFWVVVFLNNWNRYPFSIIFHVKNSHLELWSFMLGKQICYLSCFKFALCTVSHYLDVLDSPLDVLISRQQLASSPLHSDDTRPYCLIYLKRPARQALETHPELWNGYFVELRAVCRVYGSCGYRALGSMNAH